MATYYLELYSGEIPEYFASLPGAGNYNGKDYWAVLTAAPPESSEATGYLAAQEPGDGFGRSHGTDTVPAGTTSFQVNRLCLWGPKQPPYSFRVVAPDGTTFDLDPPRGDEDSDWFCRPTSLTNGRGIWVITVDLSEHSPAGQRLPIVRDNRRACFNPMYLVFRAEEWFRQPLLQLNVAPSTSPCPEITDVRVTSGCAPGEVTLRAEISGNINDIEEVTWEFGDDSPEVTHDAGNFTAPLEEVHRYSILPNSPARVTILRHQGCSPRLVHKEASIPPCGSCPVLEPLQIVSGCAPGDVVLRVQINDDLAQAVEMTVNWGDGQTLTLQRDQLTRSGDFAHTYSVVPTGPINVTLQRVERCDPNVVSPEPLNVPVCDASRCPELSGITVAGCAGEGSVTLTAEVSDAGLVEQFDWDFGDGQTAVGGQTVTHAYAQRQDFNPKVTIKRPTRCDPPTQTTSSIVPACQGPPPPRIPWCLMMMITGLVLFLLGTLFFTVGASALLTVYCWLALAGALVETAYGPLIVWIIWMVLVAGVVVGPILALIGLVMLVASLFFCGGCDGIKSPLPFCEIFRQFYFWFRILTACTFIIELVITFVAAVCSFSASGLIALIDAGALGILALVVWYFGNAIGCIDDWPKSWPYSVLLIRLPPPSSMNLGCLEEEND